MTELGAHPTRLDLTVHAGDEIDVGLPLATSAGDAQSLTGWTATAHAVDPSGVVLWDFAPAIVDDEIRVAATPADTAAWQWPYAVRLLVDAAPSGGDPVPVTRGWIRHYR